jgi:hypothetical protein
VPTRIACQWRTKLLFSSRPAEPPVLLQSGVPESLDPAERDEWQPLVRKATPQAVTPQLFTDFPSSGAGSLALAVMAVIALAALAKKKPDAGGSLGASPAP